MRKLFVMRHGVRLERDRVFGKKVKQRQLPSPTNPPLCAVWEKDIIEKAENVFLPHNLKVIYSSPFIRCIQTAHLVAGVVGAEVRIENGIHELMKEKWFSLGFEYNKDIRSIEEMRQYFYTINPDYKSFHEFQFPEGRRGCQKRVRKTFDHLIAQHSKDEPLLFVSHGVPCGDLNKIISGEGHRPSMGQIFEHNYEG